MKECWKDTDKEAEKADREAEAYAESLKKQVESSGFGMGVDDNGY